MSEIKDGMLYLTHSESIEFVKSMLHPDNEAIKKRDAFLKEADDKPIITVNENGSGRIEFTVWE